MAKAKHDADLQTSIAKQDWRRVVLSCEEYELDFASSSEAANPSNIPNYGVHLLGYFLVHDLNNAKFLWKRIPGTVKTGKPELAAVWSIGKALWNRKYDDIYKSFTSFNWTEPHKTLVTALTESFRQHTFNLLAKAYTVVSAADVANRLGLPQPDALKIATNNGWIYDSKTNFLTPKPPSTDKQQNTGLPQLQQLTDYFTYLESH